MYKVYNPMNKYEKACREWLKGCSCASDQNLEECQECTGAFLEHIKHLGYKEDGVKLEWDHGVRVNLDEFTGSETYGGWSKDKPETTMTIAQAQMAKKMLCQDIYDLLCEFENKTGLNCLEVGLERIITYAAPHEKSVISKVDVGVKI